MSSRTAPLAYQLIAPVLKLNPISFIRKRNRVEFKGRVTCVSTHKPRAVTSIKKSHLFSAVLPSVLPSTEDSRSEQLLRHFSDAPYVHPFNQPKYHALICHAWQYAKNHKKQLLWCLAQDWPLTLEEESISSEELQRLRESLLGTHDQRTNGIMGLLPLVHGLSLIHI